MSDRLSANPIRRWRSAAEAVATVIVVLAALTVLWSRGREWRKTAVVEGASSITLPTDPVRLGNASIKGNPAAPVVMIEYSDFQCPYCGVFATKTLPEIDRKYVASGSLRIAFRHLPLSSIHPLAQRAAEGSLCAGDQGRFWEMHDQLFRSPAALGSTGLMTAAHEIGLSVGQFSSCLRGKHTASVQQDLDSAAALGIRSTPTFLFGVSQPDGSVKLLNSLEGAKSFTDFSKVIDQLVGGR